MHELRRKFYADVLLIQAREAVRNEGQTEIDQRQCDAYFTALHRIDSDFNKTAYPYSPDRTVSGLTLEQLRAYNSTEHFQKLREAEKGRIEKLTERVKRLLSRKD